MVAPETVRSSTDIDRLFRSGRRASTPGIVVLVSPTPPGRDSAGRLAFIAGSKLGSAVARNRAKRRLREAARRAGAPWQGLDVGLVAREEILTADSASIAEWLRSALARTGVVE